MTVPDLTRRGYDVAMVTGSLAGAGTLGLLIPASIIMIVYGVAADVSIARLFVAGVLPGIVLMALFSGFIALWALSKRRSLTMKVFVEGVNGAVKTTCMISFIPMGASFLTAAMGFTGIPRARAEWIGQLGLAPWQLIAVLTALYIVLGCFIDGISMVVLTAAVILPSVRAAGIDLLWFGIFGVLVVEMAQITPPVGFNLYVLQSLTGRDMFYAARASLPFFVLMVVAVALIWAFPQIVTFLPEQMFDLRK